MSDIKEIIGAKFTAIADAIRYKKGTTDLIKAENFAEEIKTMGSGSNDQILFDLIERKSQGFTNPFVIPYGVTTIGNYAFSNWRVYADYGKKAVCVIPETVTSIGKYAFLGSSFSVINIPESVRAINDSAFVNTEISEITLPEELDTFGENVFQNCQFLQKVNLHKNITAIPNNTFYGCKKLKDFVIPPTIISIGNSAFSECNALNYLEIPESVTSIGNGALQMGTSSKKTTFVMKSSTPPTLKNGYVFSTSNLNKIFVPLGSRETYISTTNWSNFADYIFEPNNVVVNIPETLLNNELYQYSLDNGQTWLNFDNSVLNLTSVFTIKFKSESASPTILIGTTDGGSDIGTIANAELMHVISGNETIYLTIQA